MCILCVFFNISGISCDVSHWIYSPFLSMMNKNDCQRHVGVCVTRHTQVPHDANNVVIPLNQQVAVTTKREIEWQHSFLVMQCSLYYKIKQNPTHQNTINTVNPLNFLIIKQSQSQVTTFRLMFKRESTVLVLQNIRY